MCVTVLIALFLLLRQALVLSTTGVLTGQVSTTLRGVFGNGYCQFLQEAIVSRSQPLHSHRQVPDSNRVATPSGENSSPYPVSGIHAPVSAQTPGRGTPGKPVTIRTLMDKKASGIPVTMLTAYDASQSRFCAEVGVDCVLVGDSLAMVVLGYESTLQVGMDEMIHHCQAVARGNRQSFLIGDMPFMSYQADVAEAVRNAGRFIQKGGMHAVKLEGGRAFIPQISAMVQSGIPVCGHLGLLPQHVHAYGGYRRQGLKVDAALELLAEARELFEAGISMLVLEAVPREVAARIAVELPIPVIGIGAGEGCDGQVLVFHDLLGLGRGQTPSFVRNYAQAGDLIRAGLEHYVADVEGRNFPARAEGFSLSPAEKAAWEAALSSQPEGNSQAVAPDPADRIGPDYPNPKESK